MALEGNWAITLRAPQGDKPLKLELLGDPAPAGVMKSDEGATDLEDYAPNGDTATWKVAITSPMTLTLHFTAHVDGDKISGTARVNAFIKLPFDGARA